MDPSKEKYFKYDELEQGKKYKIVYERTNKNKIYKNFTKENIFDRYESVGNQHDGAYITVFFKDKQPLELNGFDNDREIFELVDDDSVLETKDMIFDCDVTQNNLSENKMKLKCTVNKSGGGARRKSSRKNPKKKTRRNRRKSVRRRR